MRFFALFIDIYILDAKIISYMRAVLTIAFDDGYLDTYKHAIPILNSANLKSTFSVPVGLVSKKCEGRKVVSWNNIRQMASAGHDIASHTLHHLNMLAKKDLLLFSQTKELVDSANIIKKYLGQAPESFVYPYIGKLPDKKIQGLIKTIYLSSRISPGYPHFHRLPIYNPYNIKGMCIPTGYNLNTLKDEILFAKEENLWLIHVFHLIGKKNTLSFHRNAPYGYFMHVDTFKKYINLVKKSKIQVLTQKEVIKRYAK